MELGKNKYKFYALLVGALIIFLISRKLFISLFLIFLGGFFIFSFGKNVYARDTKTVNFAMVIGFLLILIGVIYLLV